MIWKELDTLEKSKGDVVRRDMTVIETKVNLTKYFIFTAVITVLGYLLVKVGADFFGYLFMAAGVLFTIFGATWSPEHVHKYEPGPPRRHQGKDGSVLDLEIGVQDATYVGPFSDRNK